MEYLFYTLSGLTILSALMVVLSKSPVHSVLFLIITFFFISGHYILLNAQFLAIVNLIVYAGAIMVLFLFVLMLLNLNKDNEPQKSGTFKLLAIVVASGLLGVTIFAALKDSLVLPATPVDENLGLVKNLGQVLFTKYVVPFEISSILFLGAMVGAVMIGKRQVNEDGREQRELYL